MTAAPADPPSPSAGPATPTPADPPRVIREIEHKFRVHGLFELPDLAVIDGVGGVEDLGTDDVEAAYFDTADLRLIRDDIGLRRRTRGDDEGWHLKLPVAGADSSVHDELRMPLATGSEPPPALTRLVSAIVRGAPVVEVARLRGRRHRLMIRDTDGVGVAVLVDDTMEVLGEAGEVTARFRELELDPTAATETTAAVVDAVAEALTEAGALGGDFVAKVVRALGAPATAPPEVPKPEVLHLDAGPAGEGLSVAQVVGATLARAIRVLRATDLDLRRSPDDPSSVHKIRVAARRLRTALRTLRPWLDPDRTWALVDGLKTVGDQLGRLRELDVATAALLSDLDRPTPHGDDTTRERVREVLGARRRAARDAVLDLLESPRYLVLHDDLVAAVRTPLVTAAAVDALAADTLPALMERPWRRLSARVDALPPTPTDKDWHRTRLAAKRVRYAAETVAPGIGPDADRFAEAMSTVTDLLGDQRDAVVAEQVATALAAGGETTAEIGTALGHAAAVQRARADRIATGFPDVWTAAARPGVRGWFAG